MINLALDHLAYVVVVLCAAFIIGQAIWLDRRNQKRNAEPMESWLSEVPPRYQTPATRHLGETTVGLRDEEAA